MANINWSFVDQQEGSGVTIGYVPKTDNDKSGVTIGSGFDLGSKTEETLSRLNLSPDIINELKPYLGLQGQSARDVAGNLRLEKEQVSQIDSAWKASFTNDLSSYFQRNSGKRFDDLDPSLQTIAASVGTQYGVDLKNRTPKFWEHLVNNNFDGVIGELKNFRDDFPTRRNAEASYLLTEFKKKIPDYQFVDAWAKPQELGGELYLDKALKTYQAQANIINNQREIGNFEALGAAMSKNQMLPLLYRTMVAESFEPEENFSMANNKEFFDSLFKENNINSSFYDYFAGAVSKDHAVALAQRVKQEQKNIEILQQAGFRGSVIDFASWMLDPVTMGTGIGVTSKLVKASTFIPNLSRTQNFLRSGLLIGAEQGVFTSALAAESPSINAFDVLTAAALGSALGGGINVLLHGKIQKVAQEAFDNSIKETKLTKTPKGELELPTYKDDPEFIKTFNDVHFGINEISNTESVGKGKNVITLGIIPATRHASLDGSPSQAVRQAGALLVENPTFWATKGEGYSNNRVVSSPITAEIVKTRILQTAQAAVAPDINSAFVEWMKVNGTTKFQRGIGGQMFNMSAREAFAQKVFRAINATDPSNKNAVDKLLLKDPHIKKAADAYARGYRYIGQEIKNAGIEGSDRIKLDNISKNADGTDNVQPITWYQPQVWSFDNFINIHKMVGADGKPIGSQGILELIKGAILSKQPYLAKQSDLATLIGQKDVKPNFVELNKVNQVVKLEEIKTLKEKLKLEKEFLKKEKENLVVDTNGNVVQDRLASRKENIKQIQEQIKKLDTEVKDAQVKLEKDFIAKGEKEVIADITPERATAMASAIVKFLEHSHTKANGFDLKQLLKMKDVSELRVYLDTEFKSMSATTKEKLIADLGNSMDFITSGRLEERIKLNSNYEAVINGVKLRLDDLLNRNSDGLWNNYVSEMSGHIGLGKVLGLKSKNDWYRYLDSLKSDIELSYRAKETEGLKGWRNKIFKDEELKTLDSIYEHLMGRSGEEDLSGGFSTALRNLRSFNFMRVLGQVGLSSLPDLGSLVATNGLKAFAQAIPEFKNLASEVRAGKGISNNALRDLAVIGNSNGDEWAWRLTGGQEMLDTNTALTQVASGGSFRKIGEKVTAVASLQIPIDSYLRKMAMRTYIDKFATDMVAVKNANFDLSVLGKGDLNRYKVLGLTDKQLKDLAKEFTSPAVTTEVTSVGGIKVNRFNWAEFKDKDLLNSFSYAVDRNVKRAVQYNFIGDSNRFFSDTAIGKTIGQFRSFMMVAWNKQLLYNLHMGDFKAYSIFGLGTLVAGMTYMGQTHLNSIGMDDETKRKYFEKRFGDSDEAFWRKVGMAAFQRAGFSSAVPAFADMILGVTAPDYRFNSRTSGLEVNLITGNPTYNFLSDAFGVGGSLLKAMARDDYDWSQVDARRLVGLPMFKNLYGIQNMTNWLIGQSGLPETGGR
jgi:hypothetical protein